MTIKDIKAKLVDVFADRKLTGNGLIIFWNCTGLSTQEMQRLTEEMRQFESIFLIDKPNNNHVTARIFTMEEELDFAGHPLIGLAAHLHEEFGFEQQHQWTVELNSSQVNLVSNRKKGYHTVDMNQGKPEFIHVLTGLETDRVLDALNLSNNNMSDLACEVISTGLPYLIVPVANGIENAKISINDFESLIASLGAKFVYVFDVNNFEGRTWDNGGLVEDVATGSAAGPAAAFLYKAGLVPANQSIHISQGRFVGRPSTIRALITADQHGINEIVISGDVHRIASICFDL